MKLLNIVFSLLFLTFLFSCSSKDSDEEELLENLNISLISEFSANQESQSVTITSNIDWTVIDDTNWITIAPSSGTNNGLIDIYVEDNPAFNNRTGIVTVTGGDISRDLTITQAAA